jgi:phosphoglycerate dehydrogenase-like enzyme
VRSIEVWVRDRPEVAELGQLPSEVRLGLIDDRGPIPKEGLGAEFLVPPYEAPELERTLARMPKLRVVQAVSAGVEWLLPLVPEEATICNARGLRDAAVAEWVVAVLLATYKQLPQFIAQQSERRWRHRVLPELAGSTVLIVGYGSIGSAVETRLRPFDVTVERVARRARNGVHPQEDLLALLPSADAVVVLVPQTPETVGLLDSAAIERLKPGAVLINAARGPVVEREALLAALKRGRIRAALDVTDPEPLPEADPLWSMDGVLITPHLAGDSREAERRIYRFIGDQIRRYVRGEPLQNIVRGSSVPSDRP